MRLLRLRYRASRCLSAILPAALAALTLCASMPAASTAFAQAVSYTDAELISALESSYWIAVNGPRPKKVYVIASPWCPFCAQLHAMVMQNPPDAEFRFILAIPHSQEDRVKIGRAAFSRAPAALAKVYSRTFDVKKPLTLEESYAEGLNEALEIAINPALQARSPSLQTYRSQGGYGIPTLIFVSSGQLRVFAGCPRDLAPFAARIDPLDAPPGAPARLASLNAAPPKLTPLTPKIAYARYDGVTVRVAPDPAAAKFAVLKADVGFTAKALAERDGERWYAFQIAEDGPPAAFGKASDFR